MLKEQVLVPYHTSELPSLPLLIFSPHPDDEVLGMGGTLIEASLRNVAITIVYVTSGELAADVSVRENEALSVCQTLNAECRFLKLPDGGVQASRENIKLFVDFISGFPDHLIFFPSPREYHPDHRATAALVWRGAQEAKHKNALFAYEISCQSDSNVLIDVSEVYDQKRVLIAQYASQLEQNNYSAVMEGLNVARTYTLPSNVLHAESFYRFDSVEGALKDNYFDVLQYSFDDILPEERPVISILVRTQNRHEYLERALESIKSQKYSNFIEVVVVNDGGEPVEDVVDAYQLEFSKLKLINLPNIMGRSAAANAALINCTGSFINFLDDDDEFKPNHIETFLSSWRKNNNIEVLYRGVEVLSNSGDVLRIYNDSYDPGRLMRGNYIPIHAITFSRKFIDMGCRFDESLEYMEDWDFWIQLSRLTFFHHVSAITATYHMVGSSAASPHMQGVLDYVNHNNRIIDKWMGRWSAVEYSRMVT